jgi:hypothetical protein
MFFLGGCVRVLHREVHNKNAGVRVAIVSWAPPCSASKLLIGLLFHGLGFLSTIVLRKTLPQKKSRPVRGKPNVTEIKSSHYYVK